MKKWRIFLIDLKQAFDTFDVNMLIGRLNNSGNRSIAPEWLSSRLINCQQVVEMSETSSSWKHNVCAVPKGSSLGPLSFLICIIILPFEVFVSADDTNSSSLEYRASENQKIKNAIVFPELILSVIENPKLYH